MKLTQFALAAIIVLLGVAGYLTIKSDLDGTLEGQKAFNEQLLARVEDLAKKQSAPAPILPAPVAPPAPVPVAAPVPTPPRDPAAAAALAVANNIPPGTPMAAEDDPRLAIDERNLLNPGAGDRAGDESLNIPSNVDGQSLQSLTTIQQRIIALPAIARVKHYADKEGMIVLDRGTNVGLKPGDSFALRRGTAVIGRVRISDTIDTAECIVDVLPGSMPVGMLPAAGDDIIQFGE